MNEKMQEALLKATHLVQRIRHPSMRIAAAGALVKLNLTVANPSQFDPQAVADAEHDVKMLAHLEKILNGDVP